jgi:predicted negative regulator of RcsB-dependent stress response
MDADTRHQLKQNELAEALQKLRLLDDRRITIALGVVIVLLVVYAGYRLWQNSSRAAVDRAWQSLTELQGRLDALTPDPTALADLRTLIANSPDQTLTGYAKLCLAAELNRTAIRDTARREPLLSEAEQELKTVIDSAAGKPPLQAAALFALASTHESQRRLADARALYQRLVDSQQFDGSPYKPIAEERLADLDQLATAIVFTPGDPPTPPPTARTPDEAQREALMEQIRAQMAQMEQSTAQPGPPAPPPSVPEPPAPTTQPAPEPGSADLP